MAAPAGSGLVALTGGQRSRRTILSSFAGIAQRLLQIAGTLIVMPLILHAIGKQGFGVWAAAASLSWTAVVVDVGIGQALLTIVARNMADGDIEEIRHQIAAAWKVSLALSATGAILAIAIIPVVATPDAAGAYLIAALCLALNIPFNLAGNVWSGLQRFYVTSLWEAAQTLATLLGVFAVSRVSSDVRLYVAVTVGALVAANIGSTIHLLVRCPELRPSLTSSSGGRCRALMRSGTPYFVLSLSITLAISLDSAVALAKLGADDAARMALAQRACLTAYGLLWVVTQPLWPAFTHAAAHGDASWIRQHLRNAAVVVAGCAVAGGAFLVVLGQPLLDIWMGGSMRMGQDVLWAMAAWILVLSLGRVADVLLNGLGAVWFQARAAIAYSLVAFALKLTLASHFGVAGILIATVIAYGTIGLPAYVWWVARWIRKASPFGETSLRATGGLQTQA